MLVVLLFFVVLVIAALSMNVVRTTHGIKGDEATYVSMAFSVAYDADLAYTHDDVARFYRVYGSGPEGIFLKPGQGAAAADDRLFFAKSYIYPVVAAPFARLAGLNGLLTFNIVLLAGVFVCGYAFARARLSHGGAVLVSTGFLGASVAPIYAVFLTSETFNLALVFYAYFFWLYKEVVPAPERLPALLRGRRADLIAAVLLGLAAFSKLSNLPLAAPLVVLSWWRRQFRDGVLNGTVFVAVVVACFAINTWISGEWNYQGGLERKTFYGRFPFEQSTDDFDSLGISVVTNEIVLDESSESIVGQFARNVMYFVIGRHFGLLPYYFPGVAILVWAFWRRRELSAWQMLTTGALLMSAVGLVFLFPNTWSGGGGPPGNRYFLSFYPAFFFLVPVARSILPGIVIWVGGALFTAHVLIDPFIAAKNPWLLAQQGPLRALPVELTMVNDLPVRLDPGRSRIPYGSNPQLLLYYLDENATRSEEPGIWVSGRARADIVVRVEPPLDEIAVTLSAPIDNRVRVTVDGASETVEVRAGEPARLAFPVRGVRARGAQNFVISVTTREGFVPRLRDGRSHDSRFLGVAMKLAPHAAGGH